LDLPFIRSWDIAGHYLFQFLIFEFEDLINAHIRNTDIKVEFFIDIDKYGLPDFQFDKLDLDMGDSNIVFETHTVVGYLANELIKIANVVFSHTLNLFGRSMVDLAFDNIIMSQFSTWRYPMNIDLLGHQGVFDLDMRMTKNPIIADDYVDLFFYGQITPQGVDDSQVPQPRAYEFSDRMDVVQVILTDRVLNTLSQSLYQGGFLKISTDDPYFQELSGFAPGEITTETFSFILPELQDKYGKKKLKVTFELQQPFVEVERAMEDNLYVQAPLKCLFQINISPDSQFTNYVNALEFTIETQAHLDLEMTKGMAYPSIYEMQAKGISISNDQVGLFDRAN